MDQDPTAHDPLDEQQGQRFLAEGEEPLGERLLESDEEGSPTRAKRALGPRRSFPGSLGWTLLGTLIPGFGLLRTRYKIWGALMVGCAVLLALVVGFLFMTKRSLLVTQFVDPNALNVIWVALIALTLVWVLSLIVTHLSLRPKPARGWQRLLGGVAVAVLSLILAGPLLLASRRVYDQQAFVTSVFQDSQPTTSAEAKASASVSAAALKAGRINILLLGGDSGTGRDKLLGARTDTVMVASINTRTGDTVLFQLPRQTAHMPFPSNSPLSKLYPNGFYDGTNAADAEYFLNAMYRNAARRAGQNVFGHHVKDVGAEIVKQSVGDALGLDISYYAFVNMDSFRNVINALGGVTVNINEPIPMGGVSSTHTPPNRWLNPGPNQHLNGYEALWYARGRYGFDDYKRGIRQRCVINAVIQQTDPAKVIANYESITKAGKSLLQTDLPTSMLPSLVDVAMKMKKSGMRSVAFINAKDGFSTMNPNWSLVRQRVKAALAATSSSSSSGTKKKSSGSTSNVKDACAYHPVSATS